MVDGEKKQKTKKDMVVHKIFLFLKRVRASFDQNFMLMNINA